MKRILTTLALLSAFAFGAAAQRTCDIEILVPSPSKDTPFTVLGCATTDTLRMDLIGINHGPDALQQGDTFWYNSPLSDLSYINGFIVDTTYNEGDTVLFETLSIGYAEINKLWGSDGGTGLVEVGKDDFTTNSNYAALFQMARIGGNGTTVTDPDDDNNYDYGIVSYVCGGTSLDDLFGGNKKQTLVTYPNPTTGKLAFKYNFENTAASVRITDIAGRVVMSQEFGKQSGVREISLDVTSLNNGMYFLELTAGNNHAISKVTVQK